MIEMSVDRRERSDTVTQWHADQGQCVNTVMCHMSHVTIYTPGNFRHVGLVLGRHIDTDQGLMESNEW